MGTLSIYESDGTLYDEKDARLLSEDRVSNLYYAGLRFAVDLASAATIIAYFQAKASEHARYDQYYAVYESNTPENLIREFRQAIKNRVQEEYGWILNSTDEEVYVFSNILEVEGDPPGSEVDRHIVQNALKKGKKLRLGVGSYREAVSLFKELYADGNFHRGAIVTDASNQALETFDLVIEKGEFGGLEPIGESEQVLERSKRSWERRYLNDKVSEIKSTVRDIRTNTTYGNQKILEEMEKQMTFINSDDSLTSQLSKGSDSVSINPTKFISTVYSLPVKIFDSLFNLFVTIMFLLVGLVFVLGTAARVYLQVNVFPGPEPLIGFSGFLTLIPIEPAGILEVIVFILYVYILAIVFGNLLRAAYWFASR